MSIINLQQVEQIIDSQFQTLPTKNLEFDHS
jgi:hypothetical protein